MSDLSPSQAPQKPAGATPDRSARYTARLDAHLATFRTDHDRLRFLIAEQAKWIARYERFVAAVERGTFDDVPGAPTAWDYAETLAEIGSRKGRYERVVAA